MKLALDHHYSSAIAEQLRDRGHDVVAAVERQWHEEPDDALLSLCAGENRVLLTNNVGDFVTIARRWSVTGQHHAGLIFTSDAALPRHKGNIGAYVKLLDDFIVSHPGDDGFRDRIHWL